MGKVIAAAIVIALGGSILPSHANGSIESGAASTLFAAPQDSQDQLRRLEQLAARVSKLEDEVARLEEKNKQLKAQLASNAPVGFPGGVPGQPVVGPGGSVERK